MYVIVVKIGVVLHSGSGSGTKCGVNGQSIGNGWCENTKTGETYKGSS